MTQNKAQAMVWKKGQSGNPGGRPKVKPEVLAGHRIAAGNSVLDRSMGKPEQQHRVSGQVNYVQILAAFSQRLALEEAGEVEVLDAVDGHVIDDDAKANGNGAA